MFTILYYPELYEVVSYKQIDDFNGKWSPALFPSLEEAKQAIENNTFYINTSFETGKEIFPPFQENKECPPADAGLRVIPKYLLEAVEV
jgi:hypothetical protein